MKLIVVGKSISDVEMISDYSSVVLLYKFDCKEYIDVFTVSCICPKKLDTQILCIAPALLDVSSGEKTLLKLCL